jgi:guanylate kinase
MAQKQRSLFIISGPSGVGKTSVLREVIKQDENTDNQLTLSISYTTRPPRKGEIDGVNYFFVSVPKFEQMKSNGEFLESATVYGYQYGTGKQWIEKQLQKNDCDIILEIDVQGAIQIMQNQFDNCSIFIHPPSLETLKERLHSRQTDAKEVIQKRLEIAQQEIELSEQFDYWVTNDNYEKSILGIQAIICSYRLKNSHQ